jgi:iron complex transport system substrate-binding protein
MRGTVCSAVFLAVTLLSAAAYSLISPHSAPTLRTPERIITLSPSVTEAVYFLGQWDKVIAVSRYCVFPPEAADKPKAGGIEDINYEAVAAMKPDLVLLSHMQEDARERLEGLGINTLLVQQGGIDDMIAALNIIGAALGAENEAQTLTNELEGNIIKLNDRIKPYEQRSVLFVVSRDVGSGGISNVVAAGNDGYYSRLLDLLRAENPFGGHIAYANISKEGIYEINPDVIIELLYAPELADIAAEEWQDMPRLNAVQNQQICSITESYGYIPGPRFPMLAEEMARCIYPEAFE